MTLNLSKHQIDKEKVVDRRKLKEPIQGNSWSRKRSCKRMWFLMTYYCANYFEDYNVVIDLDFMYLEPFI